MFYKNCITIWDIDGAPKELKEIARKHATNPKFIAFVRYPGIKHSAFGKTGPTWFLPNFGWPKVVKIENSEDYFVIFS